MKPTIAFLAAALLCGGCASVPVAPRDKAFVIFKDGVEGRSMDPLRFAKPLVTVRQTWPLAPWSFAVRRDHYLIRDQFVLHQIVGQNPDGSYIMQGVNRETNPLPDKFPLTQANYFGTAFPVP